jgi:hypothetical protein
MLHNLDIAYFHQGFNEKLSLPLAANTSASWGTGCMRLRRRKVISP